MKHISIIASSLLKQKMVKTMEILWCDSVVHMSGSTSHSSRSSCSSYSYCSYCSSHRCHSYRNYHTYHSYFICTSHTFQQYVFGLKSKAFFLSYRCILDMPQNNDSYQLAVINQVMSGHLISCNQAHSQSILLIHGRSQVKNYFRSFNHSRVQWFLAVKFYGCSNFIKD